MVPWPGAPRGQASRWSKRKGKENKSPDDAAEAAADKAGGEAWERKAGEEAREHKKKGRRGGAGSKRWKQSAPPEEAAAAAAEDSAPAPAPAIPAPPAEEAAVIGEEAPPGKKWEKKDRQRGGTWEKQKKRAPSFSEGASGRPADWNSLSTTLYWGKKTEHHFQAASATAPEVDVQSLCAFLQKRKDSEGKPVIKLFDDPVAQEDGWFRLRRRDCSAEEVESLEEKGWERAWHGCKLEALYSIIINGLSESRDPERGDRMLAGAPGVYLHKDGTMHKAENYIRFVPLCGDGVFWAAKWEARVDRTDRVKVPRQTDQWVQRKRSVRLVALWVCGRTAADMHPGDAVSPAWDPLQEAHPFKQQEPREAEPDAAAEQEEEPSSPSRTPQERLALAGSPGWLEVRNQDGWEELWCHLCRKWGDQAHMASARHKDRALRPSDFWSPAAASPAALPALCDAAVSSTAAASPPEASWSAACGTAEEEDPHLRWLRCQGYLLRRWMGDWEDDFCLLCRKWAAATHFESKRHKWAAEHPRECIALDELQGQRGWDGDRSESSADSISGEEHSSPSAPAEAPETVALPAQRGFLRPSVATWCTPMLPRPQSGTLSKLIEV